VPVQDVRGFMQAGFRNHKPDTMFGHGNPVSASDGFYSYFYRNIPAVERDLVHFRPRDDWRVISEQVSVISWRTLKCGSFMFLLEFTAFSVHRKLPREGRSLSYS
jgi:hypothetical protein